MIQSMPVLTETIRDRKISIIWWSIGLVVLAGATAAFVPTIRENNEDFQSLIESIPEGMLTLFGIEDQDIFSPVGLLNSRLYAGIGPVLLAILGIGLGTSAIAGEEEGGTLDLLLAQPITRTNLTLQKFGGSAVIVVSVCIAIAIGLLAFNPLFDLGLAVTNIVAANIALALHGLLFLSLGLTLGAFLGRKGPSVGIAAGLTGVFFFVNGLAPLVDSLEWAQNLSPFHWLQSPNYLGTGFHLGFLLLTTATTAVLLLAGIASFNRRDIGV